MSDDLREAVDPAIMRARNEALEWLMAEGDGYPRSREQEAADTIRRGYDAYEDDAPPIAGYEQLEREGLAVRVGEVVARGETRVRFVLADAP